MRFAKVYVEITNVCNRDCSFCPKTGRRPGRMNAAQFSQIVQKLRGWTGFLYFHLMGEPLVHPELETFLTIAHREGFRVVLTTNGTLLDERKDVLLAAPALHKVNISLHSFEANAVGEMESYVNQCAAFAAQAASRGVLINFRLWNLDGKDTAGRNDENDRVLDLLRAAFPAPWTPSRGGYRLADRVYLQWGETFRWPSLSEDRVNERHGCYGLRDQIGVLCDGTVVPCCLDHEGNIPLGNLLEQPLEEILASPRAKAMYEGFLRGKAVEPLCRRCGYAERFGGTT